jgi:hypothetical protein
LPGGERRRAFVLCEEACDGLLAFLDGVASTAIALSVRVFAKGICYPDRPGKGPMLLLPSSDRLPVTELFLRHLDHDQLHAVALDSEQAEPAGEAEEAVVASVQIGKCAEEAGLVCQRPIKTRIARPNADRLDLD